MTATNNDHDPWVVKVKGKGSELFVPCLLQDGVGPVAVNPAFEDAWSSEED